MVFPFIKKGCKADTRRQIQDTQEMIKQDKNKIIKPNNQVKEGKTHSQDRRDNFRQFEPDMLRHMQDSQ